MRTAEGFGFSADRTRQPGNLEVHFPTLGVFTCLVTVPCMVVSSRDFVMQGGVKISQNAIETTTPACYTHVCHST